MTNKKIKGGGNYNINNIFNNVSNLQNNKKIMGNDSSNKIFVIIGIVLLVIIMCVSGYFLYKYFTNKKIFVKSKTLIPYIHNASIKKDFNNSSLPSSMAGNEYNINVWIYINDYTYRKQEDKCILFKGDLSGITQINDGIEDSINNKANPSIWLKGYDNTLVVCTGLQTNFNDDCVSQNKCESSELERYEKCEIKYFPIQKWVNLNVSLTNNALDIFMDGKLIKSCILSGAAVSPIGNMYVGVAGDGGQKGFNGYISKLEYSNKALDPKSIINRYKKGPTVSVKKSFLNLF